MIRVNKLSKRYGDFLAVKEVSFEANKGDIVGFLGPNGAGKTTTLRMLVTYLPQSSGTSEVAGFNTVTQADEVRKRIGYLPETPPLYPEMRVTEYLEFVARLKGLLPREIQSAVSSAIERCFLTEVSHKLCGYLSKGFKQRVGIAQAIVHDPEVIILDEPTSGLDPAQIIDIRKLIKDLGVGKTVVLSTHILPEVTSVCNRLVIINKGKTVLEDSLVNATKERSLEDVFLGCLKEGSEFREEVRV